MRISSFKSAPPVILFPLLLIAKKYGAWKIYKAAENYGRF
jgi:hypothetical protein